MRRWSGQAGWLLGRALRLALQIVTGLSVLASVGFVVLALRLSRGPLDLTGMLGRVSHGLASTGLSNAGTDVAGGIVAENGGRGLVLRLPGRMRHMRIEIRRAVIAWDGWRNGPESPFDILLRSVTVRNMLDAARHPDLAQIGLLRVGAVPALLVSGAPRAQSVLMEDAVFAVPPSMDGLPVSASGTQAAAPKADTRHPARARRVWEREWWNALPDRVALHRVSVVSGAPAAPSFWKLENIDAAIARADAPALIRGGQGGAAVPALSGTMQASLVTEDGAAPLSLQAGAPALAELPPDMAAPVPPGAVGVMFHAGPLPASSITAFIPAVQRVAAIQMPVEGRATALLGPDLQPRHAGLTLSAQPGTVTVDGLEVRVRGASLQAEADPVSGRGVLRTLTLGLDGDAGASLDVTASGVLNPLADGRRRAQLTLNTGGVPLDGLASMWPRRFAHGAHDWITKNMSAGQVESGAATLTASADADFGAPRLDGINGSLSVRNATVYWLRPVPPILGLSGTVSISEPDRLSIEASGGRAPDYGIAVKHAAMTIAGLSGKGQIGVIDSDLSGSVPGLLRLLSHPRLHLLSDHPMQLGDPAGQFAGSLSVALPLRNHVTMQEVGIRSQGRLRDLRLGGIVAGRDLENGAITYDLTDEGLSLTGSCSLAGIPSQMQIAMDFRKGPPKQITQQASVRARIDAQAAQRAGLNMSAGQVSGAADLTVAYSRRRDGMATIDAQADLTDLAAAVDRLGWSKQAGQPGQAQVRAVLQGDQLASVQVLRLTGPSLDIVGAADNAENGSHTLVFDHARMAGSALSGSILFPAAADAPVHLRLAGGVVDLSHPLKRRSPHPPEDRRTPEKSPAKPGRPYKVDGKLDRIVAGDRRSVLGLAVSVKNDGTLFREVNVTGRDESGSPFSFVIAPRGAGRVLEARASDAGGLLSALDLTDTIMGGTLNVHGRYDDSTVDHRLSGTAELRDFSVRGAPAAAKLLQAMTLYGLVDALSGPGLPVKTMIAPFSLTDTELTLMEARAFTSSLGGTLKGRIDLAHQTGTLEGTIVPAYMFNTLPGRLPLVGRLFSPEKGGGVFAATYSISGDLSNPQVSLNPLAALAPGFLRGLFSYFSGQP